MLHTYSTDSAERQWVPLIIAICAIITSFGISWALGKTSLSIPSWVPAPIDTLGMYAFYYWLYGVIIWPRDFVRRWRMSRVPNLNGTWRGIATPTETIGESAGLTKTTDIVVTIKQTWRSIQVKVRAPQSRSYSLSANLIVNNECSLSYEYFNTPDEDAPATMHPHRGTTMLRLEDNGTLLVGDYYSGRGRQNHGTLRLVRQ